MGLKILGDKSHFWQWDSGHKLLVEKADCEEVHFCNGNSDHALVIKVNTAEDGFRVVNVPDVLLQRAEQVTAYLFHKNASGGVTKTRYIFPVFARKKPEDYVYTEPEKLTWQKLSDRIDEIEQNGVSEEQINIAVEKYLEKNPIDTGVQFETDHTLKLENGVLSVNTTDLMEQDNTLPITSAGVYATVGNIEVLLKTI